MAIALQVDSGPSALDSNAARIALVALVAVALVPRIYGLGGWELSGDDAYHATIGTLPSALDTIRQSLRWDTHPPLFYLLLRAVPAGAGPYAFRVPALIFGILAIVGFHRLGRAATGSGVGAWLGALIAASSVTLVLQSQTVRHYTFLVCLETLALVAFLARFRWRDRRASVIALYAGASALVVATHYASAMLVATTGLVGAVCQIRERARRPLAVWIVVHAAIFVVWLLEIDAGPASLRQADAFIGHELLHDVHDVATKLALVLSEVHLGRTGPMSWILVIPYGAGVYLLVKRRDWIVAALGLVPLALAIVADLARVYPLGGVSRWAVWLIPPLVLPVLVALEAFLTRLSRATASAVLVAAFLANQALSPDARLITPDAMRSLDEGGRHWLPLAPHETAVASIDPAPGGRILVDEQESLRQQLARGLGWRDDTVVHGELVRCGESLRTRAEILECVRRGPPADVWVLATGDAAAARELRTDPCLRAAEVLVVAPLLVLHVRPGAAGCFKAN